MIRLGHTETGRLIIASNEHLPSDIERVEYYRDQRLFNFVFEDENCEDQLMPCEMDEKSHDTIMISPDVIIVAMAQKGEEPYEYLTPLVQIGF